MALVGLAVKLGEKMKVLHKTSNLAISRCFFCFADDGKEIDKSE